jgi:hypothetical protein
MKVQIDWLQLYARGSILNNPLFQRTSTGIKSKTFANIDEFHHKGQHIATIAYKPHSPIIKNDAHIIKFSNEILYSNDFLKHYIQITQDLGLKVRNITRIDLCFDFNYFINFRNPEALIRGFFNNRYLYSRHSMFKIIGKSDFFVIPDYLRFGSNLSTLSVYLYRKSLEMKEKIWKAYIYKQWQENEIDCTKDVWRLEFSLKGGNHNIQDMETGEQIKLEPERFLNEEFRHYLYLALLNQYFKFLRNDAKKKNYQKAVIELFDLTYCPFVHYLQTETKDLTRSDKIFIKKFEEFNQELRESKHILSDTAQELCDHFADIHGMSSYMEYYRLK